MSKPNVDVGETTHFERHSEHWWDPKGPCRTLHDLNPTRLQFIHDRCILKAQNVLDIGCGGGILTEALAKRGAHMTGIDAAPHLIEVARQHAAQSHLAQIRYFDSTAEAFANTHPAQFDVITCLELLEHVPDPQSLIQACAKLIKPGGHLFFSTLNRTPKAYLLAILGAEYCLKLLPPNTHHYEKFIRPSELESALRTANLKLDAISGLRYNPFTHRASLTPIVSVNYIISASTDF